MDNSKRDFVKKTCIGTLCLCGLNNIINASILSTDNTNVDNPRKQLTSKWVFEVLSNIDQSLSEEDKRKIIKSASIAEYDDMNIEVSMAQYKGKIDNFIEMLEKSWGWKCHYEDNGKTIIADENKDYCVCPFMKEANGKKYRAMCYCSEGFAERMFSFILGYQVNAQIISAIQYGDKKCVYKISL